MIGLISDTHGLLREEAKEALKGVERILHMGDVGSLDVLSDLSRIAPVTAVRGNVDRGSWADRLPETELLDLPGGMVLLTHALDSLDLDPVAAGIKLVLYGHTHEPADFERDGVHYVNPGAAGPRRFSLPVTLALLQPDFSIRFVDLIS